MDRRGFLKVSTAAVGTGTAGVAALTSGDDDATASAKVTMQDAEVETTLSTTSDDGTVEELILNASGEVEWATIPGGAQYITVYHDVRLKGEKDWGDFVQKPYKDPRSVETTNSEWTFENVGGRVLRHTRVNAEDFEVPVDGETGVTTLQSRVKVAVKDDNGDVHTARQVHDINVEVTNAPDDENGGDGDDGGDGGGNKQPEVAITTSVSGSVK